jgi:gamma-glutamyltranspeptidase/glutathione hydrolase
MNSSRLLSKLATMSAALAVACFALLYLGHALDLRPLHAITEQQEQQQQQQQQHHARPADGKLGAVSSDVSVCSRIGIQTLKDGGNAVDAAISTQFCLGVVEVSASGLGGGGFAVVRAKNGSYVFVDFRETAPAASTKHMFSKNVSASIYGGLASGVPGELRGLQYLHQEFASKPWADLITPSIRLARKGFVMGYDLNQTILYLNSYDFLQNDPAWAVDFAPQGRILQQGQIVRRKRYANTLETIAEEGADAFYTGAIATATVRALNSDGGIMTMHDLASYNVRVRRPLQVDYRHFRLTSGGAPSGGSIVLNVMNTVEKYANIGYSSLVNISTHRLNEAIRFGYGARTKLGDPAFVHDAGAYDLKLIEKLTAQQIRAKISDDHTLPTTDYDPDNIANLDDHGTSHLSVADHNGMAVSLTSTINDPFGSLLIVPETGVVMNNEMADFSIPERVNEDGYVPSPANFIEPGKRPLSSMSPVIVEFLANRTLYLVVGAAGGSKIITAVLQVLWHILDQGATTNAALEAPRFHDQLIPDEVSSDLVACLAFSAC